MNQFAFDLSGGRAERDLGMERVSAHNRAWEGAAIAFVAANVPMGWRGIAESLRPMIERAIGPPLHPNEYGALWRKMVKLKLFRETGEMFPMARRKSRARRSFEYIRI